MKKTSDGKCCQKHTTKKIQLRVSTVLNMLNSLNLNFISGGSTCVNAGTPNPSLSNCFLIQTEDNMEHIAKSVSDVLLISKATGGIGLSLS